MIDDHENKTLSIISSLLGYVYCILWSVASMPQLVTNFKRKSVAGYSIEFLVLNMIGFIFYSIYVWAGSVFQRHYDLNPTITIQDKIFATYGSLVTFSLATQAFILYPQTRTGTFSPINRTLCILLISFGLYNAILGLGGFLPWFSKHETPYTYSVIHYLGFAKSLCSLIKYIPQCLLNIKRKSTLGYNIFHAILDLIGGCAALLQMFIKCFAHPHEDGSPDWKNMFGNAPKLILALECVLFDLVFLIQHFILYKDNNARLLQEEEQKLLFGVDSDDFIDAARSSNQNNQASLDNYTAIQ